MAYPQSNGQVEVTNRIIIQGLKTKLKATQGNWVEELLGILWAYRTTTRAPTGETLSSIVYETEAVIPAKVLIESARVQTYDPVNNEMQRRTKLDLIGERRERARVQMEAYQHRIRQTFNMKVIPKSFQVGDLVLYKVNRRSQKIGPKLGRPLQDYQASS